MSKGLGRGLEGLFEDNAPLIDKIDEKQLLFVKISDVEPNRDQPRKAFDKQALEELSASIADRGLLQPIITRKIDGDRYQIVSGERRWRAARMAGLTEVPVIVKDLSDKEALEIGLIENLQRENLNVVEEAKGYNGPVLVIRADDDKLVDDESCKRYAGLYQAAEFVRVSGGGHNFATIPSRTACEQAIWKFIQDNL